MKNDCTIAIQETYGERFRNCWGCGLDNALGLHLKSYPYGEKECIARIIPDSHYTGGVPNNLFGGMIAVIFDCHGTASAAWFSHQKKGLRLTRDTVIGRFITARLEIDFKKPIPIRQEIKLLSKAEELTDRKVIISIDMIANDVVCAIARMIAVAVKDDM